MEKRSGPTFGVRIAAELAVIFIGVTAAFFVENYREEMQARQRAEQLTAALHSDVTGFHRQARRPSTSATRCSSSSRCDHPEPQQ